MEHDQLSHDQLLELRELWLAQQEMVNSEPWKVVVEEATRRIEADSNLLSCKDNNDLQRRKGRLEVLSSLLRRDEYVAEVLTRIEEELSEGGNEH